MLLLSSTNSIVDVIINFIKIKINSILTSRRNDKKTSVFKCLSEIENTS